MAEDVSYSSPIDTEDLQSTATHFRRGANQVRKRMWWKDLKWKIIIAITILVILGAIIGKFVVVYYSQITLLIWNVTGID